MARSKKRVGLDVINRQIETVQEEVVRAKKRYDEKTDFLKSLLDKKKEIQAEELIEAVMKSSRSYEDIMRYIKSKDDES